MWYTFLSCTCAPVLFLLIGIYAVGHSLIEGKTAEKMKRYDASFHWLALTIFTLYIIFAVVVNLFDVQKIILDLGWQVLIIFMVGTPVIFLIYSPVGLLLTAIYFGGLWRNKNKSQEILATYKISFWRVARRSTLIYLIFVFGIFLFFISSAHPLKYGEIDLLGGNEERIVLGLENFYTHYGYYPNSLVEIYPDYIDRPPDDLGEWGYRLSPWENHDYQLRAQYGFLDSCSYDRVLKMWSCTDQTPRSQDELNKRK